MRKKVAGNWFPVWCNQGMFDHHSRWLSSVFALRTRRILISQFDATRVDQILSIHQNVYVYTCWIGVGNFFLFHFVRVHSRLHSKHTHINEDKVTNHWKPTIVVKKVLATRSLKDEVFDSVEDLKHELFQTDVMLFWRKHWIQIRIFHLCLDSGNLTINGWDWMKRPGFCFRLILTNLNVFVIVCLGV